MPVTLARIANEVSTPAKVSLHQPRSLRFRLTTWYCATLTLGMLLFGVLTYGIVWSRQMRQEEGMIREVASQIESLLQSQGNSPVLAPTLAQALGRLVESRDDAPLVVLELESNGRPQVIYQSPELKSELLARMTMVWGSEGAPVATFANLEFQGTTWRLFSQPFRTLDGHLGVIRLFDDLEEVQEALGHFRFSMLVLIPAGIVCSAIGGYWLAGRALAPIGRIVRMAQEIEASNLAQRLPHPGIDDEIGQLVATLNRMIARLEGAFDSMKRFTADAAHELRSPLATLRNTIDVVAGQPRSVDEHLAALQSLGEDVDRLRRITEDLLLLARADNGRLTLERELVRLDYLVYALADTCQAQAMGRGVALEARAPIPVEVLGDERWLYLAVKNLLDNALKFTPPRGRVQVEVDSQPKTVRLTVRDSGPGIPEEDLARIFERFYQADPSRTQAQDHGSGLGLAIASWIVEAHGGRIFAGNQPGGGAIFTITLPPRQA